jgi:hypothetical protein
MKPKRLIPVGLWLLASLACLIPGLEAPAPAPVDAKRLPTIIVMTANAAASQTAVAQAPATEIPGVPKDSTLKGGTVEGLQDGSTQYSDQDGGFEVIFPVGWLALIPNSDAFNTSLAKEGADNPMLGVQMNSDLAGYEAGFDRLYAYILRPDLKKNVLLGYSKLSWDLDDTTLIDNYSMGELVRGLESSGGIPGFRASTAQVRENGNGVKLIEIGGHYSISDGEGGTIPFYLTVVFFKPNPNSLTRLTFSFLQDYNAEITTDVNAIIESIKIAGP